MICLRSGLRSKFLYSFTVCGFYVVRDLQEPHPPTLCLITLLIALSTVLLLFINEQYVQKNVLLFSAPYLIVAILRHFQQGSSRSQELEVKSSPVHVLC